MDGRYLYPQVRPSDYADSLRSSITDSSSNVIGPLLTDKPWMKERQCWVCDTPRGMGFGKARLYGCKFCLHAVCGSCSPARLFHAQTQKAERMCSLCLGSHEGEEAAHIAIEEKRKENNELRAKVKAGRERESMFCEQRDMQLEDFRSQLLRLLPLAPDVMSTCTQTVTDQADKAEGTAVDMHEASTQKRDSCRDNETQVEQTVVREIATATDIATGAEKDVQTEKNACTEAGEQTEERKQMNEEAQCLYRENPTCECQCDPPSVADEYSQMEIAARAEAAVQSEKILNPESQCQTECPESSESGMLTDSPTFLQAAAQTEVVARRDEAEQTNPPALAEDAVQTSPAAGVGTESQTHVLILSASSTQTARLESEQFAQTESAVACEVACEAVQASCAIEAQTEGREESDSWMQTECCGVCEEITQTERTYREEEREAQTEESSLASKRVEHAVQTSPLAGVGTESQTSIPALNATFTQTLISECVQFAQTDSTETTEAASEAVQVCSSGETQTEDREEAESMVQTECSGVLEGATQTELIRNEEECEVQTEESSLDVASRRADNFVQTSPLPGVGTESQTLVLTFSVVSTQTFNSECAQFAQTDSTETTEAASEAVQVCSFRETQTESREETESTVQTECSGALEETTQTELIKKEEECEVQTEESSIGLASTRVDDFVQASPPAGVSIESQTPILAIDASFTQTAYSESVQCSQTEPAATCEAASEIIQVTSIEATQTEVREGIESVMQTECCETCEKPTQVKLSNSEEGREVQTEAVNLTFASSGVSIPQMRGERVHTHCQASPSRLDFECQKESCFPLRTEPLTIDTWSDCIVCSQAEKGTFEAISVSIHPPHLLRAARQTDPSTPVPIFGATKTEFGAVITEETIRKKGKSSSPFAMREGCSDSPKSTVTADFVQESEHQKVTSREVQTDVTTKEVAIVLTEMEELTKRNEALQRETEDYQHMFSSLKQTETSKEPAGFKREEVTSSFHERISLQYADDLTVQALLARLKSCETELHHLRKPINGSRSVRSSLPAPRGSTTNDPSKASCRCVVF